MTTTTVAARSASVKPPAQDALRLTAARERDLLAVHDFLRSVVQGPSDAEFAAQNERPESCVEDRLLVCRGSRIVSHLLRSRRLLNFGGTTLPAVELCDLVTAPDHRGLGCGTALLQSAERELAEQGQLLALMRTTSPGFYQQRGWTVWPRHSYSTACPRAVLSQISSQTRPALPQLPGRTGQPPLRIRLWRHVEQAALTRLHGAGAERQFGSLVRSEACWRWLVGRRACDRIYVAIEGDDKLELHESLERIVAYAFVRDGRIVELCSDARRPDAPQELVARVCGDAIEGGVVSVRIDASPVDPLHDLFEVAGGQRRYVEADQGLVHMVRVTRLGALLGALSGSLLQRARAAQLPRPCELGLVCRTQGGQRKFRIALARRSVKVVEGKIRRSYLTCDKAELVQIVLGHLSVTDAVGQQRLQASTRTALDVASVLFPPLPVWRPPLDDLPAG